MRFLMSLLAVCSWLIAAPASAQLVESFRTKPADINDKENILYLDLSTGGRVTIWLRPDVAPKMVERVKMLTRKHFYDGLTFHRVIDGFMAQTGDPKGDGTGGSDLPDLPAEFNYLPHTRGAVSAARQGAAPDAKSEEKKKAEDTANSQFFIVFEPNMRLDFKYTVFGRVIDGMQWVDTIERGEPPIAPSKILHAYVAADNPPPYQPPEPPKLDPGALGPAVSLTGNAPPAGTAGTVAPPPPAAAPAAKAPARKRPAGARR
ncbi:peptidylprolyl isomerase [Sphingomonas sp.]|uniref:peptidylprolyl isomerase n=1 Tax=Sphingomonas sp. TaxID=28214 RepID=UPI001E04514C|nr:peptidylprolyl isomerase [Sphingomonas sp.]MBX9796046.1 peptidylprolyl isomerase [Sphingomonas sp.]